MTYLLTVTMTLISFDLNVDASQSVEPHTIEKVYNTQAECNLSGAEYKNQEELSTKDVEVFVNFDCIPRLDSVD